MNLHNTLNYIEIPVSDLPLTKQFFQQVFTWEFVDYGPEYSCFVNAGINGGFYLSKQHFTLANGSPLLVLYSQKLASTQQAIIAAGGTISQSIFSFPGGCRFHFLDPNGNEFAVWSESLSS